MVFVRAGAPALGIGAGRAPDRAPRQRHQLVGLRVTLTGARGNREAEAVSVHPVATTRESYGATLNAAPGHPHAERHCEADRQPYRLADSGPRPVVFRPKLAPTSNTPRAQGAQLQRGWSATTGSEREVEPASPVMEGPTQWEDPCGCRPAARSCRPSNCVLLWGGMGGRPGPRCRTPPVLDQTPPTSASLDTTRHPADPFDGHDESVGRSWYSSCPARDAREA